MATKLAMLLVGMLSACATGPAPAPMRADAGAVDALDAAVSTSIHVALGTPSDSDPSDDILIDHRYFVLSYNPRLRDPNWVSWRLAAADLGATPRQDNFHPDVLLPSIYPPVLDADYRESGFDRGHLCPSADRTASVEANGATFVMTNMQPQLHGLNAGPWQQLETFERRLVTVEHKDVFIVAGGVFDAAPKTIGPGIAVPRASYKVLVVTEPGQGRDAVTETSVTYAVEMPNDAMAAGHAWREYVTSINDLERETGYDFLTDVPQAVQAVLESRRASP
jgi:endonuclease G, mitochondrial